MATKISLTNLDIKLESLVFNEMEENFEINFNGVFSLNKPVTYNCDLLYLPSFEEWILRINNFTFFKPAPRFHRTREREMLDLVLQSEEFNNVKKLIFKKIETHKIKKPLPEIHFTSHEIENKYLIIYFYTEEGKKNSRYWIRYAPKNGEWHFDDLEYPHKTYVGFSNDLDEFTRTENELLFLVVRP